MKLIRSDTENKVAISFVSRLMDGDPPKDSENGILLMGLARHIQIYERKYDKK